MSNKLLKSIRGITKLALQDCFSTENTIQLCKQLNIETQSQILFVDNAGKIIAYLPIGDTHFLDPIESQFNEQLKNVVEIKENITLSQFNIKALAKSDLQKHYAIVAPIIAEEERLATLILFRESMYSEEDIILIEATVAAISLIMMYAKTKDADEKVRQISVVKSAIDTLSYSELEAALCVFEELKGKESLLVASKIADRMKITRSVIVNALRKLESAGVIESRSLGMKGTYIKVLNDLLIDELNKLRN